jgi:hypothetical protein
MHRGHAARDAGRKREEQALQRRSPAEGGCYDPISFFSLPRGSTSPLALKKAIVLWS